MPLRDHWWCILVAKYGAFLFTEIGAFVITDYKYQHYFFLLFHTYSKRRTRIIGFLKRDIYPQI
jgi:hypothetical protein